MINVDIDGCTVDILPVVKGLMSEYDRVKDIVNGSYDTFAVSLGKEDIAAVVMRKELEDDLYIEDIDVVYLHYLGKFGETAAPAPAFSALVDACGELSVPVQPLDMDEESFSGVYCDIINTFELLGESRLAKKALKKKFDVSSAEKFVISWDMFVNNSKGFRELTRLREKYMANRIKFLAKNSERMLAVVETERINGIMSILNANV
ncbi:MAG: hypothetical protein LBE48_00420 [Methanomassiliicoccaceae archaeon]|jgi:hypothetical protein|nr:hypothetical protein [Methanomassiliicoccaceae archaeon]